MIRHTVVFTLKEANADLPFLMDDYHLMIQPNGGKDKPDEGVGTGPKADTTQAFTRLDGVNGHRPPPRLLGAEWLGRWQRSQAKFPAGLADVEKPAFEKRLAAHPQFSPLA